MRAGVPTAQGNSPQGSIWGHIFNAITGGAFDKGHHEDPVEYHNRRTHEEMPEDDKAPGANAPQHDQRTTSLMNNRAGQESVTHPQLKNIMAKLNEKDDEAPMGGGKGRYTGMKKA